MIPVDMKSRINVPDTSRFFSSEVDVVTPGHFYTSEKGDVQVDVHVGTTVVTLPVINVGKDTPVWVAYAHVKENMELADAARVTLFEKIHAHIVPLIEQLKSGEYVTLLSPPSAKTEDLFHFVYEDLAHEFGDRVRYAQLIGGFDKEQVEKEAAHGFVLPCDSVITKAKGLHKYIGATDEQVELIRNSAAIIGLDDIVNTGVTLDRMTELTYMANTELSSGMQFFVIGAESIWGRDYPKKFAHNIHYSFHIPEVVGDLPR